ncbi:hypothetical protein LCGC14_1693230 [marine sediment metagenome]|uniref:Uncharacterized protein n=1 Tax=marine sediment metagenome TaxID=412755 RepID=A0A0F9HK48_9ZZZZ
MITKLFLLLSTREEWKILYNISIPIDLKGKDRLYWEQRYTGECDVLTLLIHWDTSGTNFDNFIYAPDGINDICDNTKMYTIPNDSFGGSDRFVLVIRGVHLNYLYTLHMYWKFWIERDIVETSEVSNTIGIDLIPFLLGFMCIGVIMVYRRCKIVSISSIGIQNISEFEFY